MSEHHRIILAPIMAPVSSPEFRAVIVAMLILLIPFPSFANDHKDSAAQTESQAGRFQSVDEATGYILSEHPGAKIVKVVRKKQADGSHIAKFRILTADGRMKKINVSVE